MADLDATRPALAAPVTRLEQLRAVVTFGTPAPTGMMRYLTLDQAPRVVPLLAAPHPSPANATRWVEKHERAVNALRRARELARG